MSGRIYPNATPPENQLFRIDGKLTNVFNADLKFAGITKKHERGRSLDLHSLPEKQVNLDGETEEIAQTAIATGTDGDSQLAQGLAQAADISSKAGSFRDLLRE